MDRLAQYQLLSEIARGGMGVVYRALDTRLRREVALKLFPGELSHSVGAERFLREIEIAKKLTHPNIVPVYDAGEQGGRLFYVMPLVEGETLAARLADGALLSPSMASSIASDIAASLAYAHSKGIVHRDVKPANVLLTGNRAVVADFGLSLALSSTDDRLTSASAAVGTPRYMSPEQAGGGEVVDERSDLYSLGCVLYEMLVGSPPFSGGTAGSVLRRHMTEPPRPIDELRSDVPPHLVDLVARLLAKEPEDRPGSAQEVLALLTGEVGDEDETRARTSSASRGRRPRVRTRNAAAVLLILLAGAVAWVWRRTEETDVTARSEMQQRRTAPVLAVLPFENLTGDPSLDPVGVGTAYALTSMLSTLPGVTMVSRADIRDVAASEDQARAAREVGAELLVRGSLMASGDRMLVEASLLREDDSVAWGGTFEGSTGELFDLQRRLSQALVSALHIDASPVARRRFDAELSVDRAAYGEYTQGIAFLDRPDVEDNASRAVELLESAVARDPDFAPAHAALGEAYWLRYRETDDDAWTDRARRAVERARELDPDHPSVRYSLAVIHFGTGAYAKALEEVDEALRLQPNHDRALQLRGRIFAQWGQLDAAADAFKRAIDIRPGFWDHHRRLGLLYLDEGRYDDARRAFLRVTELQPDNPWGWQAVGMSYHLEGRPEEAIPYYERASEVGPSPAALSNLGVIQYRQGDYEAAADSFRKSLELEADPVGWRNYGDALRRLSRESEAREAYENAIVLSRKRLDVNPNDAELLSVIALCEAKLGRQDAARRAIGEAEKLAPHDPDVLQRLGAIHALGGRGNEAVEALRRAISFGLSPTEVANDDDLETLHDLAEFRSLIKAAH